MGGPRRTGPDSNSWLVGEWKRRGILDHTPTEAEMDRFMRASWFLRRNKNSPHVASTSNGDLTPNRSWLARRNRSNRNCATQHSAGEPGRWLTRSNFLIDVVQGRLPKPPTLAVPRESAIPAPCAMELQRAAPHQLPTKQQQQLFVYLTLYDLSACWNCVMHHVGWGLYHSGVELCASAEHEGTEFTFDHHAGSASGVAWHAPYYSEQGRQDARSFAGVSDLPLRDRMLLGRSRMGLQDALLLLRSLAPAWPSSDYDLLDRNCHHWSECAAEALGVCEALPRWVDRTAHCLGHLRGVPDSDAGGRGSGKVAPARDRGESGGFCTMAAGYTRNHQHSESDTDLNSLGEGECECEPLIGRPDGQREARGSVSVAS